MDIRDLDKARILLALYNRSRVVGMGIFAAKEEPLTLEECRELLKKQTYFDYLYGRPLKVNLGREFLDTSLFDRDMGLGAAEFAILDEFTKPS